VIKGVIRPPGQPLMLILGLSGENVTRLVAGEPIAFEAADLGLPEMTVVIMYGKTEADIAKEFEANGVAVRVVDLRGTEP
jgi:hypothetical protein